jgi:hypothetical protein
MIGKPTNQDALRSDLVAGPPSAGTSPDRFEHI